MFKTICNDDYCMDHCADGVEGVQSVAVEPTIVARKHKCDVCKKVMNRGDSSNVVIIQIR